MRMKLRYLFLLPLAFLVLTCLYNRYEARHIKELLLLERYQALTEAVDMLAAAVDAETGRPWYEHERQITGGAEHMDGLYQIYGAVYTERDGELDLVTSRHYETSVFEPAEHPEFADAVSSGEYGGMVIGYAPDEQDYRELHTYFRWMPFPSAEGERFLVVAGVSEHSVVTQIPLLVSAGQWVNVAVAFAMYVTMILVILYSGICGTKRGGKSV